MENPGTWVNCFTAHPPGHGVSVGIGVDCAPGIGISVGVPVGVTVADRTGVGVALGVLLGRGVAGVAVPVGWTHAVSI